MQDFPRSAPEASTSQYKNIIPALVNQISAPFRNFDSYDKNSNSSTLIPFESRVYKSNSGSLYGYTLEQIPNKSVEDRYIEIIPRTERRKAAIGSMKEGSSGEGLIPERSAEVEEPRVVPEQRRKVAIGSMMKASSSEASISESRAELEVPRVVLEQIQTQTPSSSNADRSPIVTTIGNTYPSRSAAHNTIGDISIKLGYRAISLCLSKKSNFTQFTISCSINQNYNLRNHPCPFLVTLNQMKGEEEWKVVELELKHSHDGSKKRSWIGSRVREDHTVKEKVLNYVKVGKDDLEFRKVEQMKRKREREEETLSTLDSLNSRLPPSPAPSSLREVPPFNPYESRFFSNPLYKIPKINRGEATTSTQSTSSNHGRLFQPTISTSNQISPRPNIIPIQKSTFRSLSSYPGMHLKPNDQELKRPIPMMRPKSIGTESNSSKSQSQSMNSTSSGATTSTSNSSLSATKVEPRRIVPGSGSTSNQSKNPPSRSQSSNISSLYPALIPYVSSNGPPIPNSRLPIQTPPIASGTPTPNLSPPPTTWNQSLTKFLSAIDPRIESLATLFESVGIENKDSVMELMHLSEISLDEFVERLMNGGGMTAMQRMYFKKGMAKIRGSEA